MSPKGKPVGGLMVGEICSLEGFLDPSDVADSEFSDNLLSPFDDENGNRMVSEEQG